MKNAKRLLLRSMITLKMPQAPEGLSSRKRLFASVFGLSKMKVPGTEFSKKRTLKKHPTPSKTREIKLNSKADAKHHRIQYDIICKAIVLSHEKH